MLCKKGVMPSPHPKSPRTSRGEVQGEGMTINVLNAIDEMWRCVVWCVVVQRCKCGAVVVQGGQVK